MIIIVVVVAIGGGAAVCNVRQSPHGPFTTVRGARRTRAWPELAPRCSGDKGHPQKCINLCVRCIFFI